MRGERAPIKALNKSMPGRATGAVSVNYGTTKKKTNLPKYDFVVVVVVIIVVVVVVVVIVTVAVVVEVHFTGLSAAAVTAFLSAGRLAVGVSPVLGVPTGGSSCSDLRAAIIGEGICRVLLDYHIYIALSPRAACAESVGTTLR